MPTLKATITLGPDTYALEGEVTPEAFVTTLRDWLYAHRGGNTDTDQATIDRLATDTDALNKAGDAIGEMAHTIDRAAPDAVTT